MSTTAASELKRRFAALRVLIYLVILGIILSVWFIGLSWLLTHGFVTNIYAGVQTVSRSWATPVSTWRLWIGIVLLLGLIVYRRPVAKAVPVELRTLILPLPFYLLFTNDWRWSLALAALAGVLLAFHKQLAPHLTRISPLLFPLAYVYLFTRSILQTVGIAVLFGAVLLLNAWMKEFFEPVWRFQSRLPSRLALALLVVRLLIGISIPFVFSFSLGMAPRGYDPAFPILHKAFTDNNVLLVIISVFSAMFLTRSPTVERPA